MQQRPRLSTRRFVLSHDAGSTPANASDFIRHLKELASERPNITAVVYCRVSERFQDHNGNLDDQEASVRRELARLAIPVIAVYKKTESGWRLHDCPERECLAAAAAFAKERNAIVVAETTSRFVRSIDYSERHQDAVPTQTEFEQLTEITGGVILATVLHPDTLPREERGFQSRRGQQAKGRKGGRPATKKPGYKKAARLKWKPEALRLRAQGTSLGLIAKQTGVPKSTIQCWVKRGV